MNTTRLETTRTSAEHPTELISDPQVLNKLKSLAWSGSILLRESDKEIIFEIDSPNKVLAKLNRKHICDLLQVSSTFIKTSSNEESNGENDTLERYKVSL